MVSVEEIREYLRAYDSEEEELQNLIDTAIAYVDSMVGTAYKVNETKLRLAKLLVKKLCSDMYDNRSTSTDKNTQQDKIVTSILDTLSLEEANV